MNHININVKRTFVNEPPTQVIYIRSLIKPPSRVHSFVWSLWKRSPFSNGHYAQIGISGTPNTFTAWEIHRSICTMCFLFEKFFVTNSSIQWLDFQVVCASNFAYIFSFFDKIWIFCNIIYDAIKFARNRRVILIRLYVIE